MQKNVNYTVRYMPCPDWSIFLFTQSLAFDCSIEKFIIAKVRVHHLGAIGVAPVFVHLSDAQRPKRTPVGDTPRLVAVPIVALHEHHWR